MSFLDRFLGPKVDSDEFQEHRARYVRPTALFAAAAVLLFISILLPYWTLRLSAPQYPDGLTIQAYVNRLEGDVAELDGYEDVPGLNHYVGMQSFENGAVLERSVSVIGIIVLGGLVLASLRIHSRWVTLFVLPALVFPLVFVADLQYWLWRYGHSLDPRAPLANAVGEFTPPIFGPAQIANFETLALPGVGLLMAVVASVLVGIGLWYHRRAYKPLVEARESAGRLESGDERDAGESAGDPATREPESAAGDP